MFSLLDAKFDGEADEKGFDVYPVPIYRRMKEFVEAHVKDGVLHVTDYDSGEEHEIRFNAGTWFGSGLLLTIIHEELHYVLDKNGINYPLNVEDKCNLFIIEIADQVLLLWLDSGELDFWDNLFV